MPAALLAEEEGVVVNLGLRKDELLSRDVERWRA